MAIIKERKIQISSNIINLSPSGLPEGEPERTNAAYEGFFKISDSSFAVTYNEQSEGGKIFTEILIYEDCISVKKRGAINSDMNFREGTSEQSIYEIPPHKFDTEIRTRKIRNSISRDGGRIDIYYDMKIGGAEKNVKMRIDI